MSRSKTLLVSVAGGFVIATILHVVALSVGNKTITGVLLWQDTLFVYLTGPGPLLFRDAQGNPHYEGTPILALILPVGYLVSLLIYSIVAFVFLRLPARRSRLRKQPV